MSKTPRANGVLSDAKFALPHASAFQAQKMDHLGAVTSFVVTPLTFLSGTFYSVADLPPRFQAVAHANPFFYMIDGFRYGITGHADGSLAAGLAVMAGANLLLALVSWRLVAAGWRLRA